MITLKSWLCLGSQCSASSKWPVEETGRNSVIPSMIPRITTTSQSGKRRLDSKGARDTSGTSVVTGHSSATVATGLMGEEFRIETDSMGEMRVPASALYGAQTARAVENFPISGLWFPRSFIRALGLIKKHAAQTNAELGLIPRNIGEVI